MSKVKEGRAEGNSRRVEKSSLIADSPPAVRFAQFHRAALFFSAATISGAFGGLLAAAIQNMNGVGGEPFRRDLSFPAFSFIYVFFVSDVLLLLFE